VDGRRAGPFRAWSDKKAKKLEARLHEVDQGVIDGSDEIRAQRIEDARRREGERQAALRRDEAERLRQEEARVAMLRSIVDLAGRRLNPKSSLGQSLDWAAAWADRTDPYAALGSEGRGGGRGAGAPGDTRRI
jgi:hypothetical protein